METLQILIKEMIRDVFILAVGVLTKDLRCLCTYQSG